MDYEKKYKDTLKRANFYKENADGVGAKGVSDLIEGIFPELKESEDKRIIKWIRKELESKYVVENIATNIYADKALAWLEKQSEQETFCDECRKEHPSHSCQDITELGRCAIEHTEKPADKVEPRFKLGDWVVTDKGDTVQIGAVNNGYYTLYNGMDFNMSYIDKCWHRWTIQDAKDGDVLQLGNVTVIFKEFIGSGTCRCYCSACKEEFEISLNGGYDNVYGCYNATPATKEQRDFLFQKIKEAGYKWDAEKKELKKIDTIIPPFNVGDWVVKGDVVAQILDIQEQYYVGIDTNGNNFTSSRFLSDDKIHLWTIKDARPGDVLFHSDSASNGIFIFKKLLKYDFSEKVICYCDYDSEDHFCLGEPHTCCWANAKILHPATKEQRDLLFQKMKEEGYKWNANKKELKKIPSFCREHCKGYQETGKCFVDGECQAKKNAELYWSEEDENILKAITYTILKNSGYKQCIDVSNENMIDWLQSLKDRMKGE